jgi:hypothetical protein
VLGQILYKVKPNFKNVELKIDEDGIYFVSARSDKKMTTKKLIVQH